MTPIAFAIPGDLQMATGGYAYDRRVMAELRLLGHEVAHVQLPGDFPDPSPASVEETGRALKAAGQHMPLLVDGLALGALPPDLLRRTGAAIVGLVHHPLALETGISPAQAARLAASERAALPLCKAIVVTSPATAATLVAEFGVAPARITTAVPGTDKAPRSGGSGAVPRILAVGSFIPRKDYGTLVRALARLADLPWSCHLVGALDRHPDEAHIIARLIDESVLGSRFIQVGVLSGAELAREYGEADVFALASVYEGYGMVFAEALARGLPIVATTGGAIPDTVPADAGILVTPGDVAAFSDALRLLLTDGLHRKGLSDAAWRHGQALPGWADTARIVSKVFATL